jgi:hypothetical protein
MTDIGDPVEVRAVKRGYAYPVDSRSIRRELGGWIS